MCGIAGYITIKSQRRAGEMIAIANTMADAMQHRGPDSGGVWISDEVELALAHRRLSIIDLSSSGSQPMHSYTGRYVIVFNGEIYNHRALRRELASCGSVFRGHSDTEVVLAGVERWGVRQTIGKCIGMFAIALWDVREAILYLIRDRMGEKPLYYGWQKDTFLFASELKAMRSHPEFIGEICRDSLSLYFRHKYIPAPYSVYRDIFKLEPGTILEMSIRRNLLNSSLRHYRKTTYWSLKRVAEEAESSGYNGSSEDAVGNLEMLLLDSIEGQMVADVPLGAFLSGGIDSSTVVALMQRLNPEPVNTFCIGFQEQGYDEAGHAKRIAQHLGCKHTELYMTPRQVMDVMHRMPHVYDEPFADASQIPTFLVSQLARQHVTVSLSGDAGDELFYGYTVYTLLARRWAIARRLRVVNRFFRELLVDLVGRLCKSSQRQQAVIRALLQAETFVDVYRAMVSANAAPSELVLNSVEPATVFSGGELPKLSRPENVIMVLDGLSYLPDDILVKVDRAAMACSLETRIPLLDHRIVEFAFRLPLKIKCRDGRTKWPLRQILYKYVPPDFVDRPKKGFSVPLNQWLRKELREWTYDVLSAESIKQDGILNPSVVRNYLDDHMSGQHDHTETMWNLLMFQSWLHSN